MITTQDTMSGAHQNTYFLLFFYFLIIHLSGVPNVNGGKILIISSTLGGSHTLHMAKLADILATDTSHEVVLLRNDVNVPGVFKTSGKVREVVVHDPEGIRIMQEKGAVEEVDPRFGMWNNTVIAGIGEMFRVTCRGMLNDEQTWRSLGRENFDLVVVNEFPACQFLAISHYLKNVPFILYGTVEIAGTSYVMNVPLYPSYSPLLINILRADMTNPTFMNRARNLVAYCFECFVFCFYHNFHTSISVGREVWGNESPDLYEVMGHSSLIMMHGNLAFQRARPILPNMVFIGGILCKDARPLDKEFEKSVIAGHPQSKGVIYVAFGTNVDFKMMGRGIVDLLIESFNELQEFTILWKLDEVPAWRTIPSNVIIKKWMPQQDILGHNRTVAFLSHGGMNSMFEAVFHHVPTLVIPIFGDQESNAETIVALGMAKSLDKNNLHMHDIVDALRELSTDKYRESALKNSHLFRDQPVNPRESFIFWVEYVMRHKGAKHLRVDTRGLNFIQYFNLDIFLIILGIIPSLIVYMLCLICKRCTRSHITHEKRE